MDITRWSILKSDWLYSLQPKMEKPYTVSKNKTGSWLWLRSGAPYCQIQTHMKKIGKTTIPFRYNLNQVPYGYTVEVRNRFKGLDLIDSAWRTMDGSSWHCTGNRDQEHPQEKKYKKAKWLSEEALQIAVKKRRSEKQRRKGKIQTSECRVPKNSKER